MKNLSIILSRRPTIVGDLCYILTATGDVAVCDAADYDLVKDRVWTIMNGYVSYTDNMPPRKTVKLHYVICGKNADHKDGNRMNNRRSNLRKATKSQNGANKVKSAGKSSRYKGVRWDKSRDKWMAGIEVEGKSKTLGRFIVEKDAAKAYDEAAIKYFGEFARLNFPQKQKVRA